MMHAYLTNGEAIVASRQRAEFTFFFVVFFFFLNGSLRYSFNRL